MENKNKEIINKEKLKDIEMILDVMEEKFGGNDKMTFPNSNTEEETHISLISLIKKYSGKCRITFENNIEIDFNFVLELKEESGSVIKLKREISESEQYTMLFLDISGSNRFCKLTGTLDDGSKILCDKLFAHEIDLRVSSLTLLPYNDLIITFSNDIDVQLPHQNHFLLTNLRLYKSYNCTIEKINYKFFLLHETKGLLEKFLENTKAILTVEAISDSNLDLNTEIEQIIWPVSRLLTFAQRLYVTPLYYGKRIGNVWNQIILSRYRTESAYFPDPSIVINDFDSKTKDDLDENKFFIIKSSNESGNISEKSQINDANNEVSESNEKNVKTPNIQKSTEFSEIIKKASEDFGFSYIYDLGIYLKESLNGYKKYKEDLKLDLLIDYAHAASSSRSIETSFLCTVVSFECLAYHGLKYLEKEGIFLKGTNRIKTYKELTKFLNENNFELNEKPFNIDADDLKQLKQNGLDNEGLTIIEKLLGKSYKNKLSFDSALDNLVKLKKRELEKLSIHFKEDPLFFETLNNLLEKINLIHFKPNDFDFLPETLKNIIEEKCLYKIKLSNKQKGIIYEHFIKFDKLEVLLDKIVFYNEPKLEDVLKAIFTKFDVKVPDDLETLLQQRHEIVHTGLMNIEKSTYKNKEEVLNRFKDLFDEAILKIFGYTGYRINRNNGKIREKL